mgnify:CR=1 FL=1
MSAQGRPIPIGGLGSRVAWVVLLVLVVASYVLLVGCNSRSNPSTQDEFEYLAQSIDKGLMCPVCPSETIDQSQVEIAKQMKAIVREKLTQGESRDDILQFFSDRYGPSVLSEPPKHGFNLLVWVIPPLLLTMGLGLLVMVVRALKNTQPYLELEEEPLSSAELSQYLAIVDQEIQHLTSKQD